MNSSLIHQLHAKQDECSRELTQGKRAFAVEKRELEAALAVEKRAGKLALAAEKNIQNEAIERLRTNFAKRDKEREEVLSNANAEIASLTEKNERLGRLHQGGLDAYFDLQKEFDTLRDAYNEVNFGRTVCCFVERLYFCIYGVVEQGVVVE